MPDKQEPQKDHYDFQLDLLEQVYQQTIKTKQQEEQTGASLQDIWDKHMELLNAEVFDPVEKSLFNLIKSNKLDVTDHRQMMHWQAVVQTVDQIKKIWQLKIQKGVVARLELLKQDSTPQGGEPNE